MELDDISSFEWDEGKRRANLAKHGLDFIHASAALGGDRLDIPSDRDGESRVLAICMFADQLIAVVFTMRNGVCRIISARTARKNEPRAYRQLYGG
ncbi:BrnT family toxin [Rhizobium sp. SAFR-030]|uniref:BrnT family toxin n=1 Tax=Rhizobium sp. SAFR-030 TaxID=3387277 RepID=UPI003F7E4C46